jgi:hypothetical protein
VDTGEIDATNREIRHDFHERLLKKLRSTDDEDLIMFMRKGELFGLRWEDVCFAPAQLRVMRSYASL